MVSKYYCNYQANSFLLINSEEILVNCSGYLFKKNYFNMQQLGKILYQFLFDATQDIGFLHIYSKQTYSERANGVMEEKGKWVT